MKKLGFFLFLSFIVSSQVYAGFAGYTMHSRANCANNETISWDATWTWRMYVRSEHRFHGRVPHVDLSRDEWTWRAAAVCWNESSDLTNKPWQVYGEHYRFYTDNTFHLEQVELIDDCSIYDGWWDK